MSTSVEDASGLHTISHPFSEVCAWILAVSALVFLVIGTIGFVGMERSSNPLFVSLLDGALAGMCVIFLTALLASFVLRKPND